MPVRGSNATNKQKCKFFALQPPSDHKKISGSPFAMKNNYGWTSRDVIQYGQNFLKCFEISWKKHAFLFFVPGRIPEKQEISGKNSWNQEISWKISSLNTIEKHVNSICSWKMCSIFLRPPFTKVRLFASGTLTNACEQSLNPVRLRNKILKGNIYIFPVWIGKGKKIFQNVHLCYFTEDLSEK